MKFLTIGAIGWLGLSYYALTQKACRSSKSKLKRLKLSAVEERLLDTTEGINVALSKIKKIQEEEEERNRLRSSFMEHTSSFVDGFSDFVVRISGIVQVLLPQSPEYTITYGVLLIIFKVCVLFSIYVRWPKPFTLGCRNQEGTVRISQHQYHVVVKSVTGCRILPRGIPTNAMKAAIASVYVGLMCLLDEALVYYRSGRLGMPVCLIKFF